MNSELRPDQELSMLLCAMFDGEMTPAEESRLADLLRDNPEAQESYLDYCRTHALLRQELGGRCDIACLDRQEAVAAIASAGTMQSPLGEIGDGESSSDDPPSAVPFAAIPLQPFSDQAAPFSPLGSFVFSYSLAALIIGAGILIGWACKVSNHEQVANAPPPPAVADRGPDMVFVGRVTGTVDCRWSDPKTATLDYAYVPLGRRYALLSGLMEITYDTGATVILEGPCNYTVESKAGGYLGFGRLTAKVGERGEGRGEREKASAHQQAAINKQQSPSSLGPRSSPLSSLPSPLFFVRTPTAQLTDLGTEFGVAVDRTGLTESHVFRGSVLLAAVDSNGRQQGRVTTVAAHESARVEKVAGEALVVRRNKLKLDPATFVRCEQFTLRARQTRELPLKPFRHWQAFSEQLRHRGDLLAYYDFQRDPGDPRDRDGYELLRNRAPTGGKFDGRLVGSVKMGMTRGRFPGKDALQFNYPSDGVRINIPGEFPQLTLVASFAIERCNGLAGILMTDDWGQPGQLHWQYVTLGTIKFALAAPKVEIPFQFDSREAADLGRWHTWTTVYDAPAARVASYVDGRLLTEWKLADAPRLKIGAATIGNWKPLTAFDSRPLLGSIDEVAIFAAALSDADVKQLQKGRGETQQK
jgi:hypothetical protein